MERSKTWRMTFLAVLLLVAGLAGWRAGWWKGAGRVSGASQAALEGFRAAAKVEYLGELSAASSSGDDPVMTVSAAGQLQAHFPPSLVNPARGDFVTVTLPFRGLEAGTEYRLAFEFVDPYGGDLPGRLMQMAWFDDRLIYTNDLGGGTFAGGRPVEWRFRASSSQAALRVEVRAIGDPEKGWSWGTVGGMALGRLSLEPVGPAPVEAR